MHTPLPVSSDSSRDSPNIAAAGKYDPKRVHMPHPLLVRYAIRIPSGYSSQGGVPVYVSEPPEQAWRWQVYIRYIYHIICLFIRSFPQPLSRCALSVGASDWQSACAPCRLGCSLDSDGLVCSTSLDLSVHMHLSPPYSRDPTCISVVPHMHAV
jgi:hypothetical protein